jgi:hypothetical protein
MSKRLLGSTTSMYLFWDFAFLPLCHWPVRFEDLRSTGCILLEVFVNPLNLVAPFGSRIGVILPLLLVLFGGGSLCRRSGISGLMLIAPIALAMVASALRKYPFHGRLILELVPAFLLLAAEATDWVQRRDPSRNKLMYRAALILLLAYPCLSGIYNELTMRYRDFNAHGDIHRNVFIT